MNKICCGFFLSDLICTDVTFIEVFGIKFLLTVYIALCLVSMTQAHSTITANAHAQSVTLICMVCLLQIFRIVSPRRLSRSSSQRWAEIVVFAKLISALFKSTLTTDQAFLISVSIHHSFVLQDECEDSNLLCICNVVSVWSCELCIA